MLRYLYIILGYLLQPLLWLMLLKRGLKSPNHLQRLGERYGFYGKSPRPAPQGIVIHAASVGEVIAATSLIKAIQANYPTLPITITTVTPTGSARVRAAFGAEISHFYLPYDLPDAINRFLDFIQPKLVIVIETELWPNLIRQIHRRHIPFVIANARLSPRSAKRYGWFKPYLAKMFSEIQLIMAQDNVSAERYLSLGFSPAHLINTGNLKFDLTISAELRTQIEQAAISLNVQNRPVWIAGSTHEGEEELVLKAHQRLLAKYPTLLLILVPRHPERFAAVEQLIQQHQLQYLKRTENRPLDHQTQVLLGNTMGEMMLFYGLSRLAFVGGSLVKHGGHNPLEPIVFEIPVISGKYTFNFPEIFAKLRHEKGVIEIASQAEALQEAVDFLLSSPNVSKKIGQAGFNVLQENQGALARHLTLLKPYLEGNNEK